MILPRLATFLSSEDCLFMRSRWIVRIFITSDVLTFLLQGAGGGIAASSGGDKDKSHMGDVVSTVFGERDGLGGEMADGLNGLMVRS
jgi:hypothetical protein